MTDDGDYWRHFYAHRRKLAKRRRRRLKRARLCTNARSHGRPDGNYTKCRRCRAAHKLSR